LDSRTSGTVHVFNFVMQGVSVIICCHNSVERLPPTLRHLKAQEAGTRPWEVVLVDNASTDGTGEFARGLWQNGPAPLHVVDEPQLGLNNARRHGLAESKYEFLGFVDDDNWLKSDWVSTAHDVLSSAPNLGAVGSICDPICEKPAPLWFQEFQKSFAILTHADLQEMPQPPSFLNGAGLCVRRSAWQSLIENGFRFQLTDRVGKRLSAGGDMELTLALQLAGWTLRVDHRLRLQHFMPGQRLEWTYLRKLLRNYAASDVLLDAYSSYSVSLEPGFRRWLSDRWWYQLAKSVGRMESKPGAVITALLSNGEGRPEVVEVEKHFGRTLALWQLGSRYAALRHEIRDAIWRRRSADSEIPIVDPVKTPASRAIE
jgi:glycosyltransferase involved in cell wall biosynthesis